MQVNKKQVWFMLTGEEETETGFHTLFWWRQEVAQRAKKTYFKSNILIAQSQLC